MTTDDRAKFEAQEREIHRLRELIESEGTRTATLAVEYLRRATNAEAALASAQAASAKFEALTDERILMIGRRALDKCHGADAQHIFLAREVERVLASAQAASAEQVAPCAASCLAAGGGTQDDYCNLTQGECARKLTTPAPAVAPAAVTEADEAGGMVCRPNGLMFDAFGEPRTRYVRVTLDGSHCVMHPSEGDTYVKDARECGDESPYVVADVWLSEREFDDLGEFNGF